MSPARSGMPRLLRGPRLGLMAAVVAAAVLHAALAAVGALLVGRLVGGSLGSVSGVLAALLALAGGTAGTAYAGRVLAERLGQDYVHEVRRLLVLGALHGEGGRSLGITIARVTNDLTAVRAWVAQGIAPLVVVVPLALATVGVLAGIDPRLGWAAGLPLLALVAVLVAVAPGAYERARILRRLRGRLAARMTDALHAREGIVLDGGVERETRRLERASREVADAAVARSRSAGLLQASALAAVALVAALVAATGTRAGLDAGAVVTGLTLAGALAGQLGETGRVVELRQNHRAACRILGPQLAATRAAVTDPPSADEPVHGGVGPGVVEIDGLPGGLLVARAGERIVLTGPDTRLVSAVLRALASGEEPGLRVDGRPIDGLGPRERRELVGVAGGGMPLERGTVARAVRYRRPDLDPARGTAALRRVGLTDVVASLPRGERTELRHGGEPLTIAQRARLRLARATLGEPTLLVLDRLDDDLDDAGRTLLREVAASHRGVVLIASADPDRVAPGARRVSL